MDKSEKHVSGLLDQWSIKPCTQYMFFHLAVNKMSSRVTTGVSPSELENCRLHYGADLEFHRTDESPSVVLHGQQIFGSITTSLRTEGYYISQLGKLEERLTSFRKAPTTG